MDVLGFLDNLSGISEEALIKHLMEVGFNRTKAEENIKCFKNRYFLGFGKKYWTRSKLQRIVECWLRF
jgi:uncharacterized protein (DUF2132 family)